MKLWRWINPKTVGWVNKLMIQENQSCSSCPKASRLKTREKPRFWLKFESRKKIQSRFESHQAEKIHPYSGDHPSAFLCESCLQLIRWGPPPFRTIICFTQFTELNVNLNHKHPHSHNQNNVWQNIWVPCGLVKLMYNINHYTLEIPAGL